MRPNGHSYSFCGQMAIPIPFVACRPILFLVTSVIFVSKIAPNIYVSKYTLAENMQNGMIILSIIGSTHSVYHKFRLLHILFLGDEAKLIKSEAELPAIFLAMRTVMAGGADGVGLDQRADLQQRSDCCRFRGRVCLLHLPTGKEPAIFSTRSKIVRL